LKQARRKPAGQYEDMLTEPMSRPGDGIEYGQQAGGAQNEQKATRLAGSRTAARLKNF